MPQGAPENGELMVLIDNDKKEPNTNHDCSLSFVNPSLSMQRTQGGFFLICLSTHCFESAVLSPRSQKNTLSQHCKNLSTSLYLQRLISAKPLLYLLIVQQIHVHKVMYLFPEWDYGFGLNCTSD